MHRLYGTALRVGGDTGRVPGRAGPSG